MQDVENKSLELLGLDPIKYIYAICILFSIFVNIPNKSLAQLTDIAAGAASRAMASSTISARGVWAVFGNQAAMVYLENTSVATFFENKFGISELATKGALFAMPTKYGNFGVGLQYTGYEQHNESLIGFTYARWLWPKKLAMGLKINLYKLQLGKEYGSRQTLTSELGIIFAPFSNVAIGIHINNPIPQQIAEYQNQVLPTAINFGISYALGENITTLVEAQKQLDIEKTNLKAAVAFSWNKSFIMRAGIETYPFRQTLGIGFFWRSLAVDIAFFRQDPLGYTPQIALSYAFL